MRLWFSAVLSHYTLFKYSLVFPVTVSQMSAPLSPYVKFFGLLLCLYATYPVPDTKIEKASNRPTTHAKSKQRRQLRKVRRGLEARLDTVRLGERKLLHRVHDQPAAEEGAKQLAHRSMEVDLEAPRVKQQYSPKTYTREYTHHRERAREPTCF